MRNHCRETLGYLMKRAYRHGTAQAGLVGLVRPAAGLPASEQDGHLGGQELEVRGVVRHPPSGGRIPADEVHALLEQHRPPDEHLGLHRHHLMPDIGRHAVVLPAGTGYPLLVHETKPGQVADRARHRRRTDLQLLDQFGGTEPAVGADEQRDEDARGHWREAGRDQDGRELLDELGPGLRGGLLVTTVPAIGCSHAISVTNFHKFLNYAMTAYP